MSISSRMIVYKCVCVHEVMTTEQQLLGEPCLPNWDTQLTVAAAATQQHCSTNYELDLNSDLEFCVTSGQNTNG